MKNSFETVIVSFPKCGRTWLRMVVGHVLCRTYGLNIEEYSDLEQVTNKIKSANTVSVVHDDNPMWKSPDELERSKESFEGKDVIFLVRDPRDVLISSYFEKTRRVFLYGKSQGKFEGSLSKYLKHTQGGIDTIIKYFNIWADQMHVPNRMHLVRYEDLLENPINEFRGLINFIGFTDIPEEILQLSIDEHSFQNMRRMELSGHQHSYRLTPGNPDDFESFKTRKGKVGGYKDYLLPKEIKYLNQKISNSLDNSFKYK